MSGSTGNKDKKTQVKNWEEQAIDYVFNALNIPLIYYIIAVGIGIGVGLWKKSWSSGLLTCYLFFLITETLLIRKPGVTTGFRPELFWSWKVPSLRSEIWANILMFIPIGVLGGLLWKRKAVPMAAGVSLVIETVQLVSHRGLFEFDDIIHNTLGAAVGFGIYVLVIKMRNMMKEQS